jgi:hypothetical protein
MKTVHRMKTHKSKMKFPSISVEKILAGSQPPEK